MKWRATLRESYALCVGIRSIVVGNSSMRFPLTATKTFSDALACVCQADWPLAYRAYSRWVIKYWGCLGPLGDLKMHQKPTCCSGCRATRHTGDFEAFYGILGPLWATMPGPIVVSVHLCCIRPKELALKISLGSGFNFKLRSRFPPEEHVNMLIFSIKATVSAQWFLRC